jgi:hypothetical protein
MVSEVHDYLTLFLCYDEANIMGRRKRERERERETERERERESESERERVLGQDGIPECIVIWTPFLQFNPSS